MSWNSKEEIETTCSTVQQWRSDRGVTKCAQCVHHSWQSTRAKVRRMVWIVSGVLHLRALIPWLEDAPHCLQSRILSYWTYNRGKSHGYLDIYI